MTLINPTHLHLAYAYAKHLIILLQTGTQHIVKPK